MINARELAWGWRNPKIEGEALWGARCYVESWSETVPRARAGATQVTRRLLAILPDRQSMMGEEGARTRLALALNREGGILDELRSLARRGKLDGERDLEWTRDEVGIHVRCSGEYVYVTASWVSGREGGDEP
jgi:hypothetical protein